MHILMLLDKPYPMDIRVENEARTLVQAGMQVTILSFASTASAEPHQHEGAAVRHVRVSDRRIRMNRALTGTWPGISSTLAGQAMQAAAGMKVDAVHAHDLYMAPLGRAVADYLSARLVVDLHENWIGVLDDYRWSSGFPRRWVVGRRRWMARERSWLAACDGVVTVTEELAALVEKRSGIPHDRIAPVPNTVSLKGYGSWSVDEGLAAQLRERPTILYAGGLVGNRGLGFSIDAMARVREAVPDARLLILGDGAERPSLEARAKASGLESHVEFAGWHPAESVPTYVAGSTVCINPLSRTAQTDVVISHKIFQYMLGERPVIVSDCPPMRRYVEAAKAGLVVPADDGQAQAAAMISLLTDPERANAMGANGRAAVLDRFHWGATAKPLTRMYEKWGGR